MAGGRPTKYDPKYCDEAIEFMAEGFSVGAFAGKIRVSRDTLYEWASKHREFSDALKIGRSAAQYEAEMAAKVIRDTGVGNAAVAIFGLKCRGSEDWCEPKSGTGDVDSGDNGQIHQIKITVEDASVRTEKTDADA